ncbi:ubiquitin-specific protease ubp14 [Ancistrocladus abbreviatus]
MVDAMEMLRANLSRVRIPEPTNRIFKEDCCVSFDTPKSEGGLFVDMNSFLAFGRDYVMWNYEKTGNSVYLHIKQIKKVVSEDRPSKKPTRLAIGVEGGFDNNEPQYEESHSIVILPNYATLPFPSVELPEKVRLAVDAILMAEGAERKEQVAAWVAEKKQVSAYAVNLQQIDSGVVVPPSGWKCAKCDKTENLWLNLIDGMILCGRRNWDGSGGNNHAVEHYNETGYPLAVKLGTITADLEAADVYSYPEDDSVLDPLLAQHLAFFGIDFSALQKSIWFVAFSVLCGLPYVLVQFDEKNMHVVNSTEGKFVMEEGWVPKKLDVYVDVPDIIDIIHLHCKGLELGEELLLESASDGEVTGYS